MLLSVLALSAAIAALLLLVLRFRLPAFLALLLVSVAFGGALGMDGRALLASIQLGMGSTLGFVAVVVGLGAMFGALLEYAGGIRAIADRLLHAMGERRATGALGLIGFVVAIPVFFDVAFILLVPLIHRLAVRSARSTTYYAIPLLAGLAVAHAFIPPTPGPIAVANLVGASLGWVTAFGVLCGLPAMLVAGPLFARRFRALPPPPATDVLSDADDASMQSAPVSFAAALFAVLMPLVLIVCNTLGQALLPAGPFVDALAFIGHPFIALLLACLYAWIWFGRRRKIPAVQLREIMTRALEPAGIVVLVTGAGGVFKQVLVDSGVGPQLGAALGEQAIPILPLAFFIAAVIRVAQGSATVAMIAGAGLIAPLVEAVALSPPHTALVVVAIAAGATVASHVNDSGFWLVNRYLQQSERETLASWTVCSTLVGTVGFAMSGVLWLVF